MAENIDHHLDPSIAEQLERAGISDDQWNSDALIELLPQCEVYQSNLHVLAMHKQGDYVFCYEDYAGNRVYEMGDRSFINAVAKMVVQLRELGIIQNC